MLALFLLGCEPIAPWPESDDGSFESERIVVSPATFDFGEVSVTRQGDSRRELTITNLGTDVVTVTGHDEPVGDADVFRIEALPILTLQVGESLVVEAVFAPGTERSGSAHVRFDPGGEAIHLVGVGHAPVIRAEAPVIPATVLGCAGAAGVTVVNDGSEALTLDAAIEGEDFALTGWPPELLPGEQGQVEFAFRPASGGQRGGVLTLSSNDPMKPVAAVSLSALAYEGASVHESFRYAPTGTTDVIFAVEGGAFGGDPRLAAASSAYAERLHQSVVDVQVTSLASGAECPSERPYFSEVGDSVLRLQAIVGHGFDAAGGRWDDDLLGLIQAAIAESAAGSCLEGWRREGAALDVVLVALTAPATDVVAQAEALAAALPDGVPLRISALVPTSGSCGGGPSAYGGLASSYAGALGDVCEESWVTAFEGFADFPPSVEEMRYPLVEVPVPGSVAVEADHAPLTGWWWDEATNEVVVPVEAAPVFGAELDVAYVSAVSCEG